MSLFHVCRIAELEEKFYNSVSVSEVVKALSKESDSLPYDRTLISFIYEYWKVKRKANFGSPLLAPKGMFVLSCNATLIIGCINEYPKMHYFGIPRHTQLMISL